MAILSLGDRALAKFDKEHVKPQHWRHLRQLIDRDFGDGPFRFLDVGGGNGKFADQLLEFYPNSEATLLDNSTLLLDKNQPHPRKKLICDSVENLRKVCSRERFDLVSFNWVLHHLVVPNYNRTRETQADALCQAASLLTERGRISVFENMYEGRTFSGLPSWVVFALTTKKAIAPIIRLLGANTAGVGVCFGSQSTWDQLIETSGLAIDKYYADEKWLVSRFQRLFLNIRSVRCGHYWLTRSGCGERRMAA